MELLASLPERYTIIGLQFENLVLNNRKSIPNILGIDEIISENLFFRRGQVIVLVVKLII
ncbi:hypothetical protein [Wolbachia endosymbiont of Wuchereria bancrofti]|uniref:hypothetical protein n=1 Tax=Wolbachia endosymbiont of Wuchereria bancrofti TaxID=96496 RepID=UPI000349C5A4|nr:hypothetical protein [Wolbachia endosymbiont of Wuchereria bancrofti]OWZ25032.1 hypothetical protein CCY16_00489 [Wolbachia endosymbiont of Wuchereria bancrofti]